MYVAVAHPPTMTIRTAFWTTLYESHENILKCVFFYLKSKLLFSTMSLYNYDEYEEYF
jgi:hypothetical protein